MNTGKSHEPRIVIACLAYFLNYKLQFISSAVLPLHNPVSHFKGLERGDLGPPGPLVARLLWSLPSTDGDEVGVLGCFVEL